MESGDSKTVREVTGELVDVGSPTATGELVQRIERAIASYAANTQRALNADRKTWTAWCRENGRSPFPVRTPDVVDFVYAKSPPLVRANGELRVDAKSASSEARAPGTIGRYLSSLRALHRAAGFTDDPVADVAVEQAMRTIRRGADRPEPRSPLQITDLKRACARPARSLWELRDRALVAVAYSALLRRSELVSLDLRDLERDPADGSATVTVRRSKTDQRGRGEERYLAPFVVAVLDAWLRTADIREGPVFRGIRPDGKVMPTALLPGQVPAAFRRVAAEAGVRGARLKNIASHSARIGAAHDLVAEGFDVVAIQHAGGWKSPAMPAYYTRRRRAKQGAMARLFERSL
jgi:integrase